MAAKQQAHDIRHDTLPGLLKDTLLAFYAMAGPMCNELCPFEALVAFRAHKKKSKKKNDEQQFKIHVDVCNEKQSRVFVFHEFMSLRSIQRRAFTIQMLLGQGWTLTRIFVGFLYNPFIEYAEPIQNTMLGILKHVREPNDCLFAGVAPMDDTNHMNHMWISIAHENT